MNTEQHVLPADPLELFSLWYGEALGSAMSIPDAMALSTVSAGGRPSSRIVLLKEIRPEGLLFFTSYESRKSRELSENAFASLLFHWESLHRQVRVEGKANRTEKRVSDAYFATRPRGSQLGAWASEQSRSITGRSYLLGRYEYYQRLYRGRKVPRPPQWGGFILEPDLFEFWKECKNRLHERTLYTLKNGTWKREILAP